MTTTPALKSYTRSDLRQFTVAELRKLVKQHNLHTTYIRKYYLMRKDAIIDAFLKHHSSNTNSPPASLARPNEPMKRTQIAPKPSKRKTKGKRYASKPKLTAIDRAVGVDKPLYRKGVAVGAKEQFERRYGPLVPSKARPDTSKVSSTNIVSGRRRRKPKTPGKDFV